MRSRYPPASVSPVLVLPVCTIPTWHLYMGIRTQVCACKKCVTDDKHPIVIKPFLCSKNHREILNDISLLFHIQFLRTVRSSPLFAYYPDINNNKKLTAILWNQFIWISLMLSFDWNDKSLHCFGKNSKKNKLIVIITDIPWGAPHQRIHEVRRSYCLGY